jgi:hypothetical protein
MIRKLCAVSLVALTVSAAAFAGTSSREVQVNASKQCTAVQAKLGAFAFSKTFASFGACVSALTPLARQNVNSAEAWCKSHRVSGTTWGKCVSAREKTTRLAVAAAAPACGTKEAPASFATCISLALQQPTPAPQKQESATTPPGGCGSQTGTGPNHPLATECTVGTSA